MTIDQLRCHNCPDIRIQKRGKATKRWTRSDVNISLHAATLAENAYSDFDVCLFFASANSIRACEGCRKVLIHIFAIPSLWWQEYCRNSNGYFGCEETTDEQDQSNGLVTWSRFMTKYVHDYQATYHWYKLNVFTRYLAKTQQTIVLFFDMPNQIGRRLSHPLFEHVDETQLNNPFWVFVHLAEEVVDVQDEAVWAIRNQVRATEIELTPSGKPSPDYRKLHDIARHAIHVQETLDLALITLQSIIKQHEGFLHNLPPWASLPNRSSSQRLHSRLLFYEHMIASLRCRSSSNKERLVNEMQLAFHKVAQYDSGISVKIGRAAQADGAAMKTIAFVTLTFLPGTFVCAVFSMSFFHYSDTGGWAVSDKFWIYWAFAIPTTVVTAMFWYLWNKIFPLVLLGDEDKGSTKERIAFTDILKALRK